VNNDDLKKMISRELPNLKQLVRDAYARFERQGKSTG